MVAAIDAIDTGMRGKAGHNILYTSSDLTLLGKITV
jgi:hypothetical protein